MSKILSISLAIIAVVFVASCSNPSGGGSPSSGAGATVSLGSQSGTIAAGAAGTAAFAVTTKNVDNGTAGTIAWFSSSAGTDSASAPTGISASVSAVSSNAATVTMTATTSALAGSYYFKLTEGSAQSAVGTLVVSAASKWSTWFDSSYITAANPISLSYDSSTDTAAVTVTSVDSSAEIWRMNAACQVGTLAADTYVVSFSAWTRTGTRRITSNLQEEVAWGTSGNFDATLTTTPTTYCYSAGFAYARAAQVTFNCNSSTGTFYVKDVAITKRSEYPLTMPTDVAAAYDNTKGKTTVSFSCIPAAEHIFLYESTTNNASSSTLLTDYNQADGSWSGSTRIQIMSDGSSPKSSFTIAGYDVTGEHFYWISAKKSGGSESSKIPAGSVNVTGTFSNYTYVPLAARCNSIDSGVWSHSPSVAGVVETEFFYASSGLNVVLGDAGLTSTATVGVKIYLAAAAPATYVLGNSSSYNYDWQTTDQTFAIPTSGYYVIEKYIDTTGIYYLGIRD